jgi:hypothetical protein
MLREMIAAPKVAARNTFADDLLTHLKKRPQRVV